MPRSLSFAALGSVVAVVICAFGAIPGPTARNISIQRNRRKSHMKIHVLISPSVNLHHHKKTTDITSRRQHWHEN
jgi:hypothetical protein